MSESQATSSADRVKAIKKPWADFIKDLSGPFNYKEIRDRINDKKYWFEIPNKVLTFEGYIKLLAYLQNLRNDIVREKLVVDEHAGTKSAALKNMREILPGIYSSEECKTDKLRDAKAAEELEAFTIFMKQADELQKMATSVLNNIDSAIAQVNRQMKSVDMGIRTSSITTTSAKDWEESEEDDDELSINGWNSFTVNKADEE